MQVTVKYIQCLSNGNSGKANNVHKVTEMHIYVRGCEQGG